jgi:predicted RNase H-like HicB family nuclease
MTINRSVIMKVKLPALTWKEGDVYVADCPAVKIASQGDTEEEAVANLKEAIELYFEVGRY